MEASEGRIPLALVEVAAGLDNRYQTALFGWLLAKAQSAAKLHDRNLKEINVELAGESVTFTIPARLLLHGENDNNYTKIEQAFGLAQKTFRYEKNGIIRHINLIANPAVIKRDNRTFVTCSLSTHFWRIMLDFSKGFRIVNLTSIVKMRSPKAVALYILISQQTKPFTYTIAYLRKITRTEDKQAYDRGNNFIQKVLLPAKAIIDKTAPTTFDYRVKREGKGGKYTSLVLIPHTNKAYNPSDTSSILHTNTMEALRIRLDERVTDMLTYAFNMRPADIEKVEAYVLALGDTSRQLEQLADILTAARRTRPANIIAYLVAALKNH